MMHSVIGNQITVYEPTTALRLWTRKNLELGNPEYAKKQRMGFWLGNTPKVIRLDMKGANSFCKGFEQPFDDLFSRCMMKTAEDLCRLRSG